MSTEQILIFSLGGIACAVTSFLIGSYFARPPQPLRRVEYALISGIGATAICWLGYRYFPERFELWDAIPYSVMIGLFGIGRVLNLIARKYGLENEGKTK